MENEKEKSLERKLCYLIGSIKVVQQLIREMKNEKK